MITITDFYTETCPPCRRLLPILNKIVSENEDVRLIKIDCVNDLQTAIDNNVRRVPVLIIESDAEKIRLDGLKTEQEILKEINYLRDN